MRYAGNFHPEWGYLSPAPSFVRTARVVLVATAIGATTGAAVVFSLIGRADSDASVAARTLARPAEATSAQLNAPQPVAPAPATPASGGKDHAPRSLAADVPHAGTADSESKPSSTTMAPAGIAALAEVPAVSSGTPINLGAASAGSTPPSANAPAKAATPSLPVSVSSSSPSAVAPAKTAALPPAASAPPAAPAPAEKKVAAVNFKKRVAPRFAARGASSRLTPGAYYMSADNYRENAARGGYYRDNGWSGGSYYQSGGNRFQDW